MKTEVVPFKHPWQEINLGSVSVVEVGGTPSTSISAFWSDGDIPWMSSGDVHQRRITEVSGRITKLGLQSSNTKLIQPPTVAIALAGQGKTRGTAALTLLPLCTNQSVALVKGQDGILDTTYLFHALDARYEELRPRSGGGGRWGVTKRNISANPIPLPPIPEQQRIAEILDTIDEAIAHTSSIIAKLKQIKAGLLYDLLTRGLDENGELRDAIPSVSAAIIHPEQFKDSPLGRIPKDWLCLTIEQCLQQKIIIDVQDGNHGELHPKVNDFVNEGIPFIMANDLVNGKINFIDCCKISWEQYRRLRVGFACSGDVLLSHKGTIGSTAIIPNWLEQAMLTPQVTYYRVAEGGKLLNKFLFWFFNTSYFQHKLSVLSAQSTRSYIGITQQKNLHILIPSLDEQKNIISILNTHDIRIRAEEDYLEKLKLQKKGLMHDLLTGVVRVNNFQKSNTSIL